jgi:hypothetical protein
MATNALLHPKRESLCLIEETFGDNDLVSLAPRHVYVEAPVGGCL